MMLLCKTSRPLIYENSLRYMGHPRRFGGFPVRTIPRSVYRSYGEQSKVIRCIWGARLLGDPLNIPPPRNRTSRFRACISMALSTTEDECNNDASMIQDGKAHNPDLLASRHHRQGSADCRTLLPSKSDTIRQREPP